MSANELAGSGGQRAGNAAVRPATETAGATGLHICEGLNYREPIAFALRVGSQFSSEWLTRCRRTDTVFYTNFGLRAWLCPEHRGEE